jgi:NAD(P)-dependent dehydrogenase (short-subunit alcohol dehydrogenase family)
MPLKRGTNPLEVAEAVAYLIGASAVTGQMIALDGGQHLGWSPAPATWMKE